MDILKDKLIALRGKITPLDRAIAARELHCHTETVKRYLRGEVKKNDFGCELYLFLKERVRNRDKIIKQK